MRRNLVTSYHSLNQVLSELKKLKENQLLYPGSICPLNEQMDTCVGFHLKNVIIIIRKNQPIQV